MDERECLIISDKKLHVLLDHIKGPIKPVDGDVFKAEPALHAPELAPPVAEPIRTPAAPVKKERERRIPMAKPLTKATKKAKIMAAKSKRK